MKLWPRRSRPQSSVPRPDYIAIAVLEYDMFGIQPEPGTTAAAIIGMRAFGAGLVSRPSPFLLDPGERLHPPRPTIWKG